MSPHNPTGSVLFDSGPLGTGSLFENPDTLIEVWQPEDVAAGFEKLEAARANGKWLAGSVSYELGYALIPKIASRLPANRTEPLLRFGVFDRPQHPASANRDARAKLGAFAPVWRFDRYLDAFEIVQDYIRNGDIYQANLTFALVTEFAGCPHSLFHALRRKQPVPYGALVDLGDTTLLSRSPELFFSISQSGQLRARPMKGTVRRSEDAFEDRELKDHLAASEKDRAENLMITDLLRNDLGRISRIGSVCVPRLFAIESYRTVHQMVSEVVSQLSPNLGLFDIFSALFPCGSITGAPKIRSMEILSDVEQDPRGSYCGAIGWIAPDGPMEFNVSIRTLICEPSGRTTLNVGGGVVHDSTARGEYEEALLKGSFAADL